MAEQQLELIKSIFLTSVDDFLVQTPVMECSPTDSISSVVSTMVNKNIGSIIVTENKKPVGIFTERDLMKKVTYAGLDSKSNSIETVMTKNPVCIPGKTPLIKVMSALRLGKFRHLVIVDDVGNLRGVLSIKDALSFITDQVYSLKINP